MALAPISNVGTFGRNLSGSSISSSGIGNPGGGGAGAAQAARKIGQIGIATFDLFNTLSALKDQKNGIRGQSAFNRRVAQENAAEDIFKIELTSFRVLSKQTAQASSGGFSGGSASTLAIKNQTQNDTDRVVIQVNKNLQNTMREIQRAESEALQRNRGLKTKAFTSFATSILS
jgi:hypothetical protein